MVGGSEGREGGGGGDRGGVEEGAEVEVEAGEEEGGAVVDGMPEGGFVVVEVASHAGVLAALAGEEESDGRNG